MSWLALSEASETGRRCALDTRLAADQDGATPAAAAAAAAGTSCDGWSWTSKCQFSIMQSYHTTHKHSITWSEDPWQF